MAPESQTGYSQLSVYLILTQPNKNPSHPGVRMGGTRGDRGEFVQRGGEVGAARRLGHEIQPPLRQENRIGHFRRGNVFMY